MFDPARCCRHREVTQSYDASPRSRIFACHKSTPLGGRHTLQKIPLSCVRISLSARLATAFSTYLRVVKILWIAPTRGFNTVTFPLNGFASPSYRFLVFLRVSSICSLHGLFLTLLCCAVLHTVQALYFRLWFLIPTAILCGFLEVTGWSSRLWSSQNPFLERAFILQCV